MQGRNDLLPLCTYTIERLARRPRRLLDHCRARRHQRVARFGQNLDEPMRPGPEHDDFGQGGQDLLQVRRAHLVSLLPRRETLEEYFMRLIGKEGVASATPKS